jgi:phage terminase large subunit-like protein
VSLRRGPKSRGVITRGMELPATADRKALEALVSELTKRQESDPLRLFKPHEVQRKFARSILYGEKEENFYLGANRSGKSDAGAFVGATLARFGYPDDSPLAPKHVRGQGSEVSVKDRATSGWVSALDYPTSRDTIQPKFFDNGFVPPGATHAPFIPGYEIEEWRQADQLLKLRNGSILGFKSADSGRSKYQGAEKDWVQLDEEHPESIYNEIIIRVGARKLNVYTTATLLPPEGTVGGVTWLFPRVIQPWKSGLAPQFGIFNASIYDNPYIPEDEIRRLEAKFPPDSVQGRIRLGGELIPGMAGARVYSSFDRGLNVVPRQPELALRRPLLWVWDFNVEPMVSLVCQYDRPYFRVYEELVLDEGNIQEMVELFRRGHPTHHAEIIIHGDASGHDRSHQTRRSSYAMIQNLMMNYPAPMRVRVPVANPSVDGRIQAMNRACRSEDGTRLLQIDAKCEELISDLEQVVSDGRGGIKKVTNRKDSYFRRTHTSDALGYWLTYEAPVVALPRSRDDRPLPRRPGYGMTG